MDIAIKIAILGGCASIFLEFCFDFGNIFNGYYRAITAFLRYGLKRKKGILLRPCSVPKYKFYLFKILGGCIYCSNVYITTGNYLIATKFNFVFSDWLLSVVLAHVLIQVYYKYLNT